METTLDTGSTLQNKRILISGGTTGIGRATAVLMAQHGARVFIYGRHEKELQDALKDIGEGAEGIIADQAEGADISRVFESVDKKLGGLDILINNAAIGADSVVENDFESIRYTVLSNLVGYMDCAREAIKRFKKSGGGHIVNIGSMSAVERDKGSDVYTATKSGIDGFTDSLRKQVVDDNIRVSLIEPGLVGTDMTAENTPVEEQPAKQEAGEMLTAEDIAQCVKYVLTQPDRCDVIHVRIQPRRAPAEE